MVAAAVGTGGPAGRDRLALVFESLSDRLTGALAGLRGKGRLTDADIDATAREIRLALLEADVSLPVVREFIARVKERSKGAEVSGALNPAQQVVKIVNDELIGILGGQTRQLAFAKTPPTVIMLAGLQGAGKTTLAGKLAKWLKGQGHNPLVVACDLQRPGAVNQLQIVGERAGVNVFAPHATAGACLLTLEAPCRVRAVPRGVAATHALARALRTGRWLQEVLIHYSTSSSDTMCRTLSHIPRIARLSSCSTVSCSRWRPRARTVARWSFGRPIPERSQVMRSLRAIASLPSSGDRARGLRGRQLQSSRPCESGLA